MENEKQEMVQEEKEEERQPLVTGSVDDVLVPPLKEMNLGGETVKVPTKVPLEKQIPIARALKTILQRVPKLFEMDWENITVDKILDVLFEALDVVISEELAQIISVLLEKDKDWVMKHVDLADAVEMLVPFFARTGKQIAEQVQRAIDLDKITPPKI
jgi:hypothetical protein